MPVARPSNDTTDSAKLATGVTNPSRYSAASDRVMDTTATINGSVAATTAPNTRASTTRLTLKPSTSARRASCLLIFCSSWSTANAPVK